MPPPPANALSPLHALQLMYTAEMKLSATMPKEEKEQHVTSLLQVGGLGGGGWPAGQGAQVHGRACSALHQRLRVLLERMRGGLAVSQRGCGMLWGCVRCGCSTWSLLGARTTALAATSAAVRWVAGQAGR